MIVQEARLRVMQRPFLFLFLSVAIITSFPLRQGLNPWGNTPWLHGVPPAPSNKAQQHMEEPVHPSFWNVIENRRSIRSFAPQPVTDDQIQHILRAIKTCPTAGDLQAYKVVVVRDPQNRQRLASACLGQQQVANAPVALVFVKVPSRSSARYQSRGTDLYAGQDATIAATYGMLAAHALGLGTCWIGAFTDAAVAQVVGCRAGEAPVAVLPIGVPAKQPRPTPRLDDTQLFFSESL
eukprot:gnl/Trimastix_PCT/3876.p1 GENE.gnl/Trimastix_PCT/3876~~gnl/Trimastix_PCT/3876.p1  ORF type:complete len:249 (-),score=7.10 gnl/Trimastix_PCT/3876:47-757(-)